MPKKHREIIAIEREAGQAVRFTIGADSVSTEGGGAIPGGFSQLFNRVISSLSYARLPEAAKLVYPALVWMADHRRQFVIENRGYSEIAKYAGVSRSTAQKGLAKLNEAGLIRLARAAQPDGRGGLTANVYQMLVPIEGLADLPAAVPPHGTPQVNVVAAPRTVSRERGVPADGTGVDRQTVRRSTATRQGAVPPRGRLHQEVEIEDNNRSDNGTAARTALAGAGVREPVLSDLVGHYDADELLLRWKDWQNRRAAGGTLGVAWLIASIRQQYELHESTRREIDRAANAQSAAARREREQSATEAEDRRQRELDAQVNALFDEMSDEELAHWKAEVVAEFPTLIRNPDRADPRVNDRLRRLILGKLALLVAPPDAPVKPAGKPSHTAMPVTRATKSARRAP